VNGQPLPWLVGLKPCDSRPKRSYARGFQRGRSDDNREWSVEKSSSSAGGSGGGDSDDTANGQQQQQQQQQQHYRVRSLSTGRCLSAVAAGSGGGGSPVLLPCDASKAEQAPTTYLPTYILPSHHHGLPLLI
jgi:hypothetical protein